jgi:hypothetical protein
MTTTLNASTSGVGGFIATGDNSGSLALQTAGTTAVTIDTSQNVGIGTSSPGSRLGVTTSTAGYASIITNTNGASDSNGLYVKSGTGSTEYNLRLSNTSGSTDFMLVKGNGSVGIGVAPDNNFFLTVQSSSNDDKNAVKLNQGSTALRTQISFNNPNGQVGTIQTNGSLTSYNVSSDYRLKNTISPMTGALAKIALLKPCTYKWNVDSSDGEGFIAHELAEVCPNAVNGDKDAVDAEGNPVYQGIDVSFLVATLTAAIQELKAINDTQAETINALTARIEALEGK